MNTGCEHRRLSTLPIFTAHEHEPQTLVVFTGLKLYMVKFPEAVSRKGLFVDPLLFQLYVAELFDVIAEQ